LTLAGILRNATIVAVLFGAFVWWYLHATAAAPVLVFPQPPATGGPIRIAVIADHFQSGEEQDFNAAVQNFIVHSLLADTYYAQHASAFTVKSIFEAWTPGSSPSKYGFQLGAGVTNCRISWASNTTSLVDAVVRASIDPAFTVIIGNYDYNFGCSQDTWSYVAVGSLGNRILEHEMGHTIGGLDDEFAVEQLRTTPYPGIKEVGNCTTLVTPQWNGVASSGRLPECDLYGVGIFHAFKDCRMRVPVADFCPVCSGQMDDAINDYTSAILTSIEHPIVTAGFFGFQPAPPPRSGRAVSVLVRVNNTTGKTLVLSTTDVPGSNVQHHRRLGDYVYEIIEGGQTKATSVIPGDPFHTHAYNGSPAPHASPAADDVAIAVTIPDVNRSSLANGQRTPEIIFYKLGRVGADPITPQRLAELKTQDLVKQVAKVDASALKYIANGGKPMP